MMIKPPKSIVVFRALELGDLLCSIPVFRALRKAFPDAHIALIGLERSHAFVSYFKKYIDELIVFPGYFGLPEKKPDIVNFPDFLKTMQTRNFDLFIQLHGNGTIINNFIPFFGASVNAGFYSDYAFCPDKQTFMYYPENGNEIWRNLKLLEFLGIPIDGDYLEFFTTKKDDDDFERLKQTTNLKSHQYVCIHPGSRHLTRRWNPQRFAIVADMLAFNGYTIVLTGSSQEEDLISYVGQHMNHSFINAAGKTTLGHLAALIKNARLLVTNDTGVSHIAAAVSTPSVIIVTGSDPLRWAPLEKKLHRTVLYPISCRPCTFEICPIQHPCSENVTVSSVLEVVFELLA